MATIKPKKSAVITKGINYSYDQATFKDKHAYKNFIETDDPQEILDNIVPFELLGRKFITFDTETHPYFRKSTYVPKGIVRRWVGTGKQGKPQDFPFCISVCDGKNAYTIYDTVGNQFRKFKELLPLFMDSTIEKIAHNWKFDAHMFANANMKIKGKVHDTVVLTKVVNENRRRFDLEGIASTKEKGIVKFERMVDTYKKLSKITDYRDIPRELLSQYANADVWNAFIVFEDEFPLLEKLDLTSLYEQEMEVMIAMYAMERYGCKIDTDYEQPLKEDLTNLVQVAEQEIYDEAGTIFNINSTKQLYQVLLTKGLKPHMVKYTEAGNPSLDKQALITLSDKYNISIVKKILEYRKNVKLLNTYAIGIYDQRDADDLVHCNINQTEATTGRMSITKPALQTLPKKDKRIRRAFIPFDDSYELYFMDLDQIEYRLFAHYAKIPSLIDAIKQGFDVHAATAATLNSIGLDEMLKGLHDAQVFEAKARDADNEDERNEYLDITKSLSKYTTMRSNGKTINFALVYGIGDEHLSVKLMCTITEAIRVKQRYFANMPEAKRFINTVHAVIREKGFVKNFYDRRRSLKSYEAYKAPNALIQSCAADYFKCVLVRMYKYMCYYLSLIHI